MSAHVATYAAAGLALVAAVYLTTLVGAAWAVSIGAALSIFSSHWDRLGVPVGLDRVLVAIGVVVALLRLGVMRRRPPLRLGGTHLVLLAALAFAFCSALWGGALDEHTGKFRLLDAFGAVPFVAFALAPIIFRDERERRILLGVLVACGAYLGLTTLFESSGLHALVVPKYILDPTYGIHANRARGPFVEAVANGVALFMCATAAVIGTRLFLSRRARRIAGAVALLCIAGVPLTYTRTVWIGAAAGTVAAIALSPGLRRWLVPTVVTMAAAVWIAILVVPGLGAKLEHRYSDQTSVDVRSNTNVAAEKLIAEHPIVGVGWNHELFYSGDAFRLVGDVPPLKGLGEPVHSVFLSRFSELGIVGGGLWVIALLVGVVWPALIRPLRGMYWWRAGLIAVAVAWTATGLFGPLDYAFPTLLLWLWAGIVAFPASSSSRPATAAAAV